ncbi:hypothetical protein BJV82DRAFT_598081 [Fennellomyces sp. T-0311]|nr:hypothetical protein BJV82DRAFT_598081 [Fennellomyces sp. T-0311]
MPVNLVHQHLHVIDRLLRFHFGPQWHTHVENVSVSRRHRVRRDITLAEVSACIARLSLISTPKALYTCDMLCCVEQVELHDDLRSRLAQTLHDCCDMAFSSPPSTATRFTSFFATPPRTIPHPYEAPLMWSDAFLFAKNKIVVKRKRSEIDELLDEDLPQEILFYLCHMASEYADQAAAREDLAGQRHRRRHGSSRSQNITESSYTTLENKPVYATSSDSTPTPQASSSEATSQKSSVTYVYDSSSITAPFKVKEKSSYSITVASSNCSTPSLSWSSPPMHNQLLSRLTRRSPSKLHHPLIPKQEELPPNAKIFHSEPNDDEHCLSSSLPLEKSEFGGRRRSSTPKPVLFQSSAPSSPAIRSRSQSNASTKQSLRNMFSSFLQQNDTHSDDEVPENEGKVMSRWIKIGHRLVLCLILLIHLGDGLCAAIICRRDHDDTHTTVRDRMTNHSLVRTLRTSLQERLQDFSTFLLTKEATHFTILSFITAYPGLLHFIHLKNGVMLAPTIVDLNEFNHNHRLLLEIGEKYEEWATARETWGWPSLTKLQDLCEQMVQNESHDQIRHVVKLDSSSGRGFQCAYQRGKHGDLLMALYFSFIPKHAVLEMHQRLFMDVSQRLP